MAVHEEEVFDLDKLFSSKVKLINSQLSEPLPLLRGSITELKLQVPESSLVLNDGDVVATASSKKRSAKEPPQIYLGKDYFLGCTTLEFTPKEKRVDLYCNDDFWEKSLKSSYLYFRMFSIRTRLKLRTIHAIEIEIEILSFSVESENRFYRGAITALTHIKLDHMRC